MLEQLETLIAAAMEEWQVPGLAIAVVIVPEEVVEVKGYGLRDREAGLSVTNHTQFRLCSITKSFTAAALGTLVDDGKLDWANPVRDYLPEFRLQERISSDEVRVRDLLSHHSGLPPHEWIWMPGDLTREQMLASLRHLEPSCALRESFQYQNLGYLALGMMAERIAGEAWEDLMRERLLAPLGITEFSFSRDAFEQMPDVALPYAMVGSRSERAEMWPISDTPAGGLNTSITGLARWLRCLLGRGASEQGRVLSAEVVEAMQTPRVYAGRAQPPKEGHLHYGFGLGSHHYRGDRVVGHTGGWIGWGALMSMLPERGLGVAVLTNRDPSPVPDILAYAAFDIVCGRDPIPWLQRCREHEARSRKAAKPGDKRSTRPVLSRPVADYAGAYGHPAYGRMTVAATRDGLRWGWRGMKADLEHCHDDVFMLPSRPGTLFPSGLTLTFSYDRTGAITRVSAPLEPKVAEIQFMLITDSGRAAGRRRG
jgi:CubicO group peptidase (beta-lactamase class C family)